MKNKYVTSGKANHWVKQYRYGPSKKTFKKVYKLIGLLVDEIQKVASVRFKKKPIIGYVLGTLSRCKGNAFDFIVIRILRHLRYIYRLERDLG